MDLEMKLNRSQIDKYRREGHWGDATLADLWRISVLSFPEKTVVKDNHGLQLTYKETDRAADRIASFLIEAGIQAGDSVSVQLPGWAEFMMIYVACLKTGAVINPLLPNFKGSELTYILKKCESKVLFIPSQFRKQNYPSIIAQIRKNVSSLQKVVVVEKGTKAWTQCTLANILKSCEPFSQYSPLKANDLAAVLFTSGTEGVPKGVMLTHNNIIASERAFCANFHLNYLDTVFMPAPVAHAIGFHHGLTASFMIGATCVLQDVFNAEEALRLIEREPCTAGMGSTPVVHDLFLALQRNNYNLSSLRFFLCGGSPIPREMLKTARNRGIRLMGVYGSTESVPHTAAKLEDSAEKIFMTDGASLAGIEVKIVDKNHSKVPPGVEGEEASRGPNVFAGYLKEPALTDKALDKDGWYYSGDLGVMDKDGYIRITGRIKDIIIRGGENISSSEVEGILMQHPNVREASVIAMPDSRLGERSCAYVVLNDVKKGLSLNEVITFFKNKQIAMYKIPERVEIVDSLPHTASLKVKKYLLREDIKRKLKSSVLE
ncbi:medium-chain fatty-acid--CoA ligase [Sporolactobacillus sp. KGMB 08714]|uniref:medium-chain fatty-acid--CoA ligase n=1 Tax=Sporolactobacillus sp. KGMB 08714 TaxID=3064704 RepID=UPI002FBD9608